MPLESKKPDKPYDHRIATPGGHPIDVHSDPHVSGGWMNFPGHDRSLSVQSVCYGGQVQNYVGYRNGHAQADRLAISVMDDDSVQIQVILPGEGDEVFRVRTLTLEQLDELVRAMPPGPQ